MGSHLDVKSKLERSVKFYLLARRENERRSFTWFEAVCLYMPRQVVTRKWVPFSVSVVFKIRERHIRTCVVSWMRCCCRCRRALLLRLRCFVFFTVLWVVSWSKSHSKSPVLLFLLFVCPEGKPVRGYMRQAITEFFNFTSCAWKRAEVIHLIWSGMPIHAETKGYKENRSRWTKRAIWYSREYQISHFHVFACIRTPKKIIFWPLGELGLSLNPFLKI